MMKVVKVASNQNRSEAQLSVIGQLLSTLDPFFRIRGTMPLRHVQAYLLVAQKEGQTVTELAKKADMPVTTMSRNLLDMGERNRYFEEGAGLVEGEDNPLNRRERLYTLTHKGRALLASITKGASK
jgi:DNA-binding MarR family transcriptional regulator